MQHNIDKLQTTRFSVTVNIQTTITATNFTLCNNIRIVTVL